MTYFYIYKTTNLINNKFYIGVHKTNDLNDGYIGSGTLLKYAVQKYGIENFKKDIIEFFTSSEQMYVKELQIVNEEFLKRTDVYNINIGGHGGWHLCNKNSKNLYGMNGKLGYGGENLIYGNKQKELLIERGLYDIKNKKISKTLKQKHQNGELTSSFSTNNPMKDPKIISKQKTIFADIKHQQGIKNSQYGTQWISNLETRQHKKIKKSDAIPRGWILGRINFQSL